MTIGIEDLAQRVDRAGAIVRVVVTGTAGSTPREAGAEMLVWDGGMAGTIGGGTLEHDATRTARELLRQGHETPLVSRKALGPGLGQCCGGSMTLLFERMDQAVLSDMRAGIAREGCHARPVASGSPPRTQRVDSAVEKCRSRSPAEIVVVDGWAVEPAGQRRVDLWVFGAGHVGRAVVGILANLEGFRISWVDFEAERFPSKTPGTVERVIARRPEHIARYAPNGAWHLVFTHSHDLDLAICDALLRTKFESIGLIGSSTKWKRFRRRLIALGHAPEHADRIRCPIGRKSFGKEPWAIATGVAAELLESLSS